VTEPIALIPVITRQGLASAWTADSTGVAAKIVAVVLGDQGYAPDREQAGLRNPLLRVPVADGQRVSDTQIHVSAVVDGPQAFWVREVAFELDNGKVLAIWSDPNEPLAYKSGRFNFLIGFDLVLDALPVGSVTVVSTGANLSLAAWGEQYISNAAATVANMARHVRLLLGVTTPCKQ